jgi:hypothetical protein
VDLGNVGFEPYGMVQAIQRFFMSAQGLQHRAQLRLQQRVSRIGSRGALEIIYCVNHLSALRSYHTQQMQCVKMAGLPFQHALAHLPRTCVIPVLIRY